MNLEELDLVAQWVEINKKLEAGWAPFRDLAGERDEIEKKVVFLKNKGVSPYPKKAPLTDKPPNSSTILLDDAPPGAKRARTEKAEKKSTSQKNVEKRLEKLKSKGGSEEKSRSEIGMNVDDSQNFQNK